MDRVYNNLKRAVWLALLLAALGAAPAYAQDPAKIEMSHLDRFADKADKVIDVTVGEGLVKLAMSALSDKRPDEAKIRDILSGLRGVYVKRFEFASEGEYTAADVESIRSQLNGHGWERIANVRSKREGNYDVVIMSEGSVVKGLAVLAAEPRALTVVNIVGAIDLAKLRDLEGKFGIPNFGLESIPGVTVRENRKDRSPEPEQQQQAAEKRPEKKPPQLIRPEKPPTE